MNVQDVGQAVGGGVGVNGGEAGPVGVGVFALGAEVTQAVADEDRDALVATVEVDDVGLGVVVGVGDEEAVGGHGGARFWMILIGSL